MAECSSCKDLFLSFISHTQTHMVLIQPSKDFLKEFPHILCFYSSMQNVFSEFQLYWYCRKWLREHLFSSRWDWIFTLLSFATKHMSFWQMSKCGLGIKLTTQFHFINVSYAVVTGSKSKDMWTKMMNELEKGVKCFMWMSYYVSLTSI